MDFDTLIARMWIISWVRKLLRLVNDEIIGMDVERL